MAATLLVLRLSLEDEADISSLNHFELLDVCLRVRVPYDAGILHDWLKESVVAQHFYLSGTRSDIPLKKGTGGVGLFGDSVDVLVPAEVLLQLDT